MKDSRILYFLKGFPAPLLLSLLFLIVLWGYLQTNDAFLQRVIDTILGGLLGVVTGRGTQQSQSANTNSGDVVIKPETDLSSLTTGEIENIAGKIEEK